MANKKINTYKKEILFIQKLKKKTLMDGEIFENQFTNKYGSNILNVVKQYGAKQAILINYLKKLVLNQNNKIAILTLCLVTARLIKKIAHTYNITVDVITNYNKNSITNFNKNFIKQYNEWDQIAVIDLQENGIFGLNLTHWLGLCNLKKCTHIIVFDDLGNKQDEVFGRTFYTVCNNKKYNIINFKLLL